MNHYATSLKKLLCVSILCPLATLSSFHSQAAESVNVSGIDEIFAHWKEDTPGGVVGLLHKGKPIYTRAFGLADLDTGVPITLDTKFHVASVAKTFTAFSVLLLEEQGLLSLDDDIREYVPELPDFGESISVADLLHHFSGLRNWNTLFALKGISEDDQVEQESVLQLLTQQLELNHAPGKGESYSNTNFYLLSLIIERITGKSFRDYTREEIFLPLDMDDTFYADDLGESIEGLAWGHFSPDGENFIRDMPQHNVVGSGNLITTLNDFVKWEKNLLAPTVGSRELVEKLYSRGVLDNGVTSRFAKGLGYSMPMGINTRGMAGGTPGYRSNRSELLDQEIVVIILSNSTLDIYTPNMEILRQCCASEVNAGEDILTAFENKFVAMSEPDLEKFAGAYRIDGSNDILFVQVNSAAGGLIVSGLEFPFLVKPITDFVFESINPIDNDRISFSITASGETTFEIAEQGINTMTATSIPEVSLDGNYLEQFTGTYQSAELQAAFDIVVVDDQLYRTGEGFPSRLLVGRYRDLFQAAGNTGVLLFERDDQGEVVAFRISVAGVTKLLYEKL